MPVHDFVCEPCDVLIPDQYHPSVAAILCCPDCGRPMEKSWHRPPRPLFLPFTADIGPTPTEIRSLADVRRVEAESERRARNGEGQQVVFRAFSNDQTNYDVNTLTDRGVKQRFPEKKRNVTRTK